MLKRLVQSVAFCSLASCGGGPESLGQARQAIFGGTADLKDPAAVAMTSGNVVCSGSLISPKVVLTAGHCIAANNDLIYFMNSPFDKGNVSIHVAKSYTTPDFQLGFRGHDIGIVVMDSYAAQPPMAINTTALNATDVDAGLRLIGFGDTSVPIQFLSKHELTVPISDVSANEIQTNTGVCHGDSGGAGLMTFNGQEVVSGVISWTGNPPSSCASAVDGLTRVDVYAAWIQQQIALDDPPSCAVDGRCVAGCTPPDPDCACGAGDLGRACNDHDPCTVGETCDNAGNCQGGAPNPCDSPPTECFEATGACVEPYGGCPYSPKPSGAPCDGGTCNQGGSCIPTVQPDGGEPLDAGANDAGGVAPELDGGVAADAGAPGDAGAATGRGPNVKGGCGASASGAEAAGPWLFVIAGALARRRRTGNSGARVPDNRDSEGERGDDGSSRRSYLRPFS